MAQVQDSITGLYVTYFDRAPDQAGLNYWLAEASKSTNPADVLNQISTSFLSVDQQNPTGTNYPASMSNSDFVKKMYDYALDRQGSEVDPQGQAFWEGRVAAVGRTKTMVEFINAVLDFDPNSAGNITAEQKQAAIDAQAMLKNKIAVGQYFASQLASNSSVPTVGNPPMPIVTSREYLASQEALRAVSQDPATKTDAMAKVTNVLKPAVVGGYDFILNPSVSTVEEGGTITFTVTPVFPSDKARTVTFSVLGDTLNGSVAAGSASDVDKTSGTLNIPANTQTDLDTKVNLPATASFSVKAINDGVVETLEGMKVSLLDADGKVVGVKTFMLGDVAGDAYTLTNSTDVATAAVFEAPQVYTPGGDDRINSLQDEDRLTGKGGNAVLNATLGNANDNGDTVITPTLNDIATINVAFTGSSAGGAVRVLDLQDATGEKAINITRVSQATNDAEVANIMSVVEKLSIANTNANNAGVVEFSYGNGVLKGANTGSLEVKNVQVGTVNIGQNTSGVNNRTVGVNGYEQLTINSTVADNAIGVLNLPMDTGVDGKVTITGDKALKLAGEGNVVNRTGAVEAKVYDGGINQPQGRLAAVDASGLAAGLTLNIGNRLLSTGKADTSGVVQDVSIKGSKFNDTFYLNDAVQQGDSLDGNDGDDTLIIYGGSVVGKANNIENVSLQLRDSNAAVNFANLKDAKIGTVRNITTLRDVNGVLTNVAGDDGTDQTATLSKLTAIQASDLHIQHSTTGNNGVRDTTLDIESAQSGGVVLSIDEGVNADPRFNFTLKTKGADSTVIVNDLTLKDNDTESNTVILDSYTEYTDKGTDTGTITLSGGVAGKFLNLDAAVNKPEASNNGGLYNYALNGAAGFKFQDFNFGTGDAPGVRVVDLSSEAEQIRLGASVIDASNEQANVTLRVGTNAQSSVGAQTIKMGAGDDTVIFDNLNAGTAATIVEDTHAGLSISDTVQGGGGTDTLVIDGNVSADKEISISSSEWTNVSGFENARLIGAGQGSYRLTLTDAVIQANHDQSGYLNIINDNDSINDKGFSFAQVFVRDMFNETLTRTDSIDNAITAALASPASSTAGGISAAIKAVFTNNDIKALVNTFTGPAFATQAQKDAFVASLDTESVISQVAAAAANAASAARAVGENPQVAGLNAAIMTAAFMNNNKIYYPLNPGQVYGSQESAVVIDARTLSAGSKFSYNGEEGTDYGFQIGSSVPLSDRATTDRIILSDVNFNGNAVIDGGAIDNIDNNRGLGSNDGSVVGNGIRINEGNADVIEVVNGAVVTAGDLANIKNIGTLSFTNQTSVEQTSVLQLNDEIVDRLVDSYQASVSSSFIPSLPSQSGANVEALRINALDSKNVAGATTGLKIDAGTLTDKSALHITLARGVNDVVSGAGSDHVVLLGNYASGVYADNVYGVDINAQANNVAGLRVLSDKEVINLGSSLNGTSLDTLTTYGNIDLTQATLSNIETLEINSNVRLTQAQYNALTSVVFNGTRAHNLTIVDSLNTANPLTSTPSDLSKIVDNTSGAINVTVEPRVGVTPDGGTGLTGTLTQGTRPGENPLPADGNTPASTAGVLAYEAYLDEAAANNGSVTDTAIITLTGDTFKGAVGSTVAGITVTNAPAGLTPVLTIASATTATLSFTGNATAHANANDVSGLVVNVPAVALTKAIAPTQAAGNALEINFADPLPGTLTYSTSTFVEAAANNGTINTVSTLTLTGDTFAAAAVGGNFGGLVSNVPAGLTASLQVTSPTTAQLSFVGSATAHANANDVSNVTVTLPSVGFTSGIAPTGAVKNNIAIDFADPIVTPGSLAYSGTLAEAAANNGSITATTTLTLSGDTFTGAVGSTVSGVSVTNLPAGLTAVVTVASPTTATLSFTGNATAHANANDVSGLTVSLPAASVAKGVAPTTSAGSSFGIDFADTSAFTTVDLSAGNVAATAAAEAFTYDFQMVGGRATKAGDGEVSITGFDVANDKLVFNDVGTGTVLTEAQFKALAGVSISESPFQNNTTIYFDPDAGNAGGVTLLGIQDAALANIVVETLA